MKTVTMLVTTLLLGIIPCRVLAADESAAAADVRAAVERFNEAYASGEVETYFDYYAPDATVFFYGARQDLAAYQAEWSAMLAAGGAVEKTSSRTSR